jgi:hypothetical protein
MGRAAILCCALALTCSQAAWASCQDDLQQIRPRVDNLKFSNKPRYAIANRWWVLAQEDAPKDEVGCLNYYARVVKAINEPIAEINNCIGPNQYLDRCQATGPGGVGQGMNFGTEVGMAGGGGAVGGGGGATGPVGAPAGPVGGPATQPFSPPGSVGSIGGAASPPEQL